MSEEQVEKTDKEYLVLKSIISACTNQNLLDRILGYKKSGRPRAIYDVYRDYTGEKKKKRKRNKDTEKFSLYLGVGKKKKNKRRNTWRWGEFE